jgi:hypothetical protein
MAKGRTSAGRRCRKTPRTKDAEEERCVILFHARHSTFTVNGNIFLSSESQALCLTLKITVKSHRVKANTIRLPLPW